MFIPMITENCGVFGRRRNFGNDRKFRVITGIQISNTGGRNLYRIIRQSIRQ